MKKYILLFILLIFQNSSADPVTELGNCSSSMGFGALYDVSAEVCYVHAIGSYDHVPFSPFAWSQVADNKWDILGDSSFYVGYWITSGSYPNTPDPTDSNCLNDQIWDGFSCVADCTDFEHYNDVLEQCESNTCESGEMRIYSAAGELQGCVQPDSDCEIIGHVLVGNFDYCQGEKDECESEPRFGSYGSTQDSNTGELEHSCVLDAPPPANCASGDQMILLGDEFACIDSRPSQDVCDGGLYDCDADGNVDDQDANGVVDNGIGNALGETGSTVYNTGTGSGGVDGEGNVYVPDPLGDYQIPLGGAGGGSVPTGTNIGDDAFSTAAEGAGQCDPTATNYLSCIAQQGVDGEPSPLDGTVIDDETSSTGECNPESSDYLECVSDKRTGSLTDIYIADKEHVVTTLVPDTIWESITTSPIIIAVSAVGQSIPDGNCPQPSFDAFGENFTIDMHCTLLAQQSDIISAFMIAFWSLMGIRVVMSA